jgi:hypothetical protein
MSFPSLRKRIPSTPVVVAASGTLNRPLPASRPPDRTRDTSTFSRLMQGFFGTPNPPSYGMSEQVAVPGKGAFWNFHEGDQFSAGAPSFVLEPTTELTPIYPFWGRSFLSHQATLLKPYQPPQVMSEATVMLAGLGGLQAGQFVLQGLEEPTE